MIAIEETTTIQPNGRLVLQHAELIPGEKVKVIVLLSADRPEPAKPPSSAPGRKLKQDWAGGLADMAQDYTSVELQHQAQ